MDRSLQSRAGAAAYGAVDWVARTVFGSTLSRSAQRAVLQVLVASVLLSTLLGLATVIYGAFYWHYIPKVSHTLPVFFDYGGECGGGACAPTALVALRRGGASLLSSGQAYDVALRLHVPESHRNLDLPNFMVELGALDTANRTIGLARRPVLLRHKTPLARWLTTAWRAVPLVLGFFPESQRLELPLLQQFEETYAQPAAAFVVRLSSAQLQLYDAQLQVDAHFYGLRYFMYYWFFSTAAVVILIILFWETLAAVVLYKLAQSIWQQARAPRGSESSLSSESPSPAPGSGPSRRLGGVGASTGGSSSGGATGNSPKQD